MKHHKAPLGASLVVLSSLFYASYGIWTKLMGNSFGGNTASLFRSILVVLFLLVPAYAYRQFEPLRLRQNWHYIAGMVVFSAGIWGPLYYAIQHAGVGLSLTINYAGIVIGMFLFGRLFMGERFTRDKFLATILGVAGLTLVFSPSTGRLGFLPLAAAALSGLATAGNMALTKKITYKSTQTTIALWVTGSIASLLVLTVVREPVPSVGLEMVWLYLLLFAVASVAASWLFITGLKLVDAGAAGILGLLEIVFGVLFGVVLFHEHISVMVAAGIAAILAAAAIPYLKDYNAAKGRIEEG